MVFSVSKTTNGSMSRGTKARDVWKVKCEVCRRKRAYSAITWSGKTCPECRRVMLAAQGVA